MERVSFSNLRSDLLNAGCRDVATIFGFFDLLDILSSYIGEHPLVRHLIDEAFLEDLIDFVASQLNWRDRHRLTTSFLL